MRAEILLPEPFILFKMTKQRRGCLLAAPGRAADHAGHVAELRMKRRDARGVDMCRDIRSADEETGLRQRRVSDQDQLCEGLRIHGRVVGFRLSFLL